METVHNGAEAVGQQPVRIRPYGNRETEASHPSFLPPFTNLVFLKKTDMTGRHFIKITTLMGHMRYEKLKEMEDSSDPCCAKPRKCSQRGNKNITEKCPLHSFVFWNFKKLFAFILSHFTASINLLFWRLGSSSGRLFLWLFLLLRIRRFLSSNSELYNGALSNLWEKITLNPNILSTAKLSARWDGKIKISRWSGSQKVSHTLFLKTLTEKYACKNRQKKFKRILEGNLRTSRSARCSGLI